MELVFLCNVVATPTQSSLELERPRYCDASEYRSLVGKLLFAANVCRFNISYIVGLLSRHFHLPEERHLQAAKHVLRYLKGTRNYGLNFNQKPTSI